ncbi:MAG TPA: ferredoxin family protein [Anaerolineales bacterium]|jgi:2-oxoglutarate ferredoxin oxidoreductase subunit delta|nr:ferredoxin family protein [Anaerolineales bacterium]
MPIKGWIEVDELYCKGCDLCVNACPQEVISLDLHRLTPKGYHPAYLSSEGCTGCAICAIVCPEAALTIYREVPAKRVRAAA